MAIPDFKEGATEVPGTEQPDDKAILQEIERREKAYSADYEAIKKRAQKARKYWGGDQIDESQLQDGEKASPENLIYSDIETIIPTATRKTPDVNLTIFPKSKNNRLFAQKEELELKDQWQIEQRMQHKMEAGLRNAFEQGFLAFMYYFDSERKDYCFEMMKQGEISFDTKCATVDELPCLIRYRNSTYGKMIKLFGKEKMKEVRSKLTGDVNNDTKITYIEYHKPESFVCKYDEVLLTKPLPNPNWNKDGFNHFAKPRIPIIFMNYLSHGDSLVDDKSLVEILMAMQDSVNRRKIQEERNVELMNGQWVIDAGALTKEQVDALDHQSNTKIIKTPGMEVRREYATAFPQAIFQSKESSKMELHNQSGVQDVLRGQRKGSDAVRTTYALKESSLDRLELLHRAVEYFANDFYDACIQMQCVHYEEEKIIAAQRDITPEQEAQMSDNEIDKQDVISKSDFAEIKKIRCLVNENSTVPRDKVAERQEAKELMLNGKMADVDFYKIAGYPDYKGVAKRNYLQQTRPDVLYGYGDQIYDIEAIRQIRAILSGQIDGADEANGFVTDSVDIMANHIRTQKDYINGVEIDEDFPPFENLTEEAQASIAMHHAIETAHLDEMLMMEQQRLAQQRAMLQDPQAAIVGAIQNNMRPQADTSEMPTGGMQDIPSMQNMGGMQDM
jgi:hypothetical protein